MPGSIRIARVAGIDVYIHVTFFLLLAYFGWLGLQGGGEPGMVFAVLAVSFLFACVLLHEFGHALAARHYGIATPDITLLPIGGVARIERMPDKPDQEIVIALAGPAVNVAIAFLLGAAMIMTGTFSFNSLLSTGSWKVALNDIPTAIINLLFWNNLVLAAFNMIPAFPMDGGRVLRALLAKNVSLVKATHIAAGIGKALAMCFGLIGLFNGWPLFILLALFVFIGATQEARSVEVHAITRGASIQDVMITNFKALSQHARLQEAIDALLAGYQHDFPVVDADGGYLGVLTRPQMLTELKRSGSETPVLGIMNKEVKPVTLNTDLEHVLQQLDHADTPLVPVEDQFGRVIGLVVPENVSEMILVREALKEREEIVRANEKLHSKNF